MSIDDSSGSGDNIFQTPSAALSPPADPVCGELETPRPEPDVGASPELSGPVTRSGRKRKNLAPVKSTGKKKNKMMPARSPPTARDAPTGPEMAQSTTRPPRTDPPPQTEQDLASLLANGLANIRSSMGGMEDKLGRMEDRLVEKIDSLESSVKKNKDTIMRLTDTVNKNTVDLARLETEMRANDQSLDRRVAELVRSHTAPPTELEMSCRSRSFENLVNPRATMYWQCRRSLRLWPISGQDLKEEVKIFLRRYLELDLGTMGEEAGVVRVRRVCEPRSKIKDEVIAEFTSPALRDTIKGCGYKLEGKEAGIRMEVPNCLRSDFHVLQNLSYKLKQSNSDMKRSLKFDDGSLGLILDIKLSGQEWQRIRPEQARSAGRTDPSLRAGPQELSGDMIASFTRPHSMSLGQSGSDSGAAPGSSSASGSNATPLGRRQDT